MNDVLNNQPSLSVSPSVYDKYFDAKYKELHQPGDNFVKFDPFKHLRFYAEGEIARHKFNNTRRLTMAELALESKKQAASIGVTDPFPLFTDEAVRIMKQEILERERFLRYTFHTYLSKSGKDCIMRGYVKENGHIVTPFTYAAWTNPVTTALVSEMAGVELELIFDYEIAHVNISVKEEEEAGAELARYKDKKPDDDYVVNWHKDSYPFVCVMMLSDTTNMIGGETCLRTGKGVNDIVAVPGPTRGYGFVLQGGLIEHIAPNPVGSTERITMVTSYRAKDPRLYDASSLYTVKPEISPGTRTRDFYSDWISYRSRAVTERLALLNKEIQEKEEFEKDKVMDELKDIAVFLADTCDHMAITDSDIAYVKRNMERLK